MWGLGGRIMSVYKAYFKILKKFKTPIIIYTFLFIGLAYALTMNTEIGTDQYETIKVKTMIINEDGQSALLDGFLDYMGHYITYVEPGKDDEAIKDALFFEKAEYILIIPKGFSDSFENNGTVKLSKQAIPNSVEATSMDTVIDNYFNMAKVYQNNVPDLDYEKLNTYIKSSLSNNTQTIFSVETKDDVTYANEFNQFYFNFMGYIIVAAFILSVSMIMFSYNGVDIRRRHTASPLNNYKMNLQLILANLIFVIGYLMVFIIAGFALNKSRIININLILTWLNALVFSITVLSFSYLIGITVNNRKAIGAISTAVSLGIAFTSGIFVPQVYLGSTLLRVASFLPAYWYVKANDTLVSITAFEWSQVSDVFGYMAIQTGFTIAIISIALVISKRKRQQAF